MLDEKAMNKVFSLRLKEAMNIRNIKAVDLVEKTGISKARISQYMKGVYTPKSKSTYVIAKALNVSETWLMGLSDIMERETEKSNISYVYPKNEVYSIPLFESVSAGFGAYADSEVLEYIPIVLSNPHDLQDIIAIKVKGDSMYPLIIDGDCIIVRKQESVDSGTIGVVLLDGNEGLVKRIVYGDDWIELQSVNPEYAPKRFEGAEVQRLRVVGKVTKIDREL